MNQGMKAFTVAALGGAILVNSAGVAKAQVDTNSMARAITTIVTNTTATSLVPGGAVHYYNGLHPDAKATWADFAVPSFPRAGFVVKLT